MSRQRVSFEFSRFTMFRLGVFRYWLFLFAAVVIVTLGWSSYMLIGHPYCGVTWSFSNGNVLAVDQKGPANGQFRIGDQIRAINGISIFEARNLPNYRPGDWISFIINKQGQLSTVTIQLIKPPLPELVKRISIIPIAIAFWLLGTIVLAFGISERLIILFFLFCQTTSLILGLGAISSYAPLWAWWIFGLLLWWIGPLTLHTHLALVSFEEGRTNRRIVTSLYLLAFLFSLVDMYRLRLEIAGAVLTFKYIWLGICILASAGLLIFASFRGTSVEHRQRTRITGISAITAFLPFVFFSLIPDAVTGQFILPYEITLLALLIFPLGFSYAILLYRLVKVERNINQSAAYGLATFIIIILYTFLYLLASNNLFIKSRPYSIIEIVIIVILTISAHSVHQALYRWLHLVFYGGWFDNREAVKRMFQDLQNVQGDTNSIAQALCQTLQRTMLIDYANLLLSNGRLFITTKEHQIFQTMFLPDSQIVNTLFYNLQIKTGHELGSGEELKIFLSTTGFSGQSLLGQKPQLWVLFGGISHWQGLLVLGPKHDRGDFETKDMEILEVVLRQAGAALENGQLLEEVRQRSNQIRELNRKSRWTLEVERKRIARDLHDLVIQTLVGINYQLANIRTRDAHLDFDELEHIRSELQESLGELRGICADLRPPSLDALGLVPAIEARITEISGQVPFVINLKCAELQGYEIDDEVTLCTYRFLQEALLNIQKHSTANIAIIDLQVDQNNCLQISIEDDGAGFSPPKTLEMFVAEHHFGLVGLQEQVEAVGGKMVIHSEVGKGCRITASLPIKPGQGSNHLIPIEEEIKK